MSPTPAKRVGSTNQTDEEEKKNAGKTFDVTCEFTMGDTVACATSVRTTQGDFTCSCEPWEEDLFGELRCLAVEGNVLEEGL